MNVGIRLLLVAVGVLVLVALVVGGILLLRDDDPPTSYDAQIEEDFLAACTADAEAGGFAHPRDFCACAYGAITRQVPFDEFLRYDESLRDEPQEVPPVIDRIRSRCYVQVEAPGQGPPTLSTVPP